MKNIFETARTIRRFDVSRPLSEETVMKILLSVTKVASAANLQRIRYRVVTGESAAALFPSVSLGGSLPPEKKPTPDVAPTAYAVMLTEGDVPDVNLAIDMGIAAEAIVLTAASLGIGACMIRNFRPEAFAPKGESSYVPRLVIALGYPAERAETVVAEPGESLRYHKDEDGVNRVPKLPLSALLLN